MERHVLSWVRYKQKFSNAEQLVSVTTYIYIHDTNHVLSRESVRKYLMSCGNTHEDLKLIQINKLKIITPNLTKNPTHKHWYTRNSKSIWHVLSASTNEKHNLQKKWRNINIKKLSSLSLPLLDNLPTAQQNPCRQNFVSAHLTLK